MNTAFYLVLSLSLSLFPAVVNKMKSCVFFSGNRDYMQVKWLFQKRFFGAPQQ